MSIYQAHNYYTLAKANIPNKLSSQPLYVLKYVFYAFYLIQVLKNCKLFMTETVYDVKN